MACSNAEFDWSLAHVSTEDVIREFANSNAELAYIPAEFASLTAVFEFSLAHTSRPELPIVFANPKAAFA